MSIRSSQNDIEAILPDFGRLEYSENPYKNLQVIQTEFIRSARSILLDYELVYEKHRWPITALELYFYHSKFWPDETTHFYRFKQKQQLERGTWYVHHGGKGRAPGRLGIDITAGCKNKEIAAGLLISAIGKRRASSGTAFKTIIRAGMDCEAQKARKLSETDCSIIEKINEAKSINEGVLTLQRPELKASERSTLWTGPRMLDEVQGKTEFVKWCLKRCLRVATFEKTDRPKKTDPPMKKLLD